MSWPTELYKRGGVRARSWVATVNNYTDDEVAWFKQFRPKKLAVGFEVGESGTKHLQIMVMFDEKKTRSAISKMKGFKRAWTEPCHHPCEAWDYSLKDEHADNIIHGERPEPGKRTDLKEICDLVLTGKRKVDEICEELPDVMHQYGRTLTKVEDIALRKRFRREMTKGVWIYGPTGTGKSHRAFEGYSPDTHYLWKLNDKNWQDGYTGQEIVIINDFRGEISYNELLQMIDKWPHNVPRRGREPAPFLAKKVIITSSLSPQQAYHRRMEEDSIEQLLRRLEVVELTEIQKV